MTLPLVRAFLEGRKTVTRRLIHPQPQHQIIKSSENGQFYDADCINPGILVRPKYLPGDIVGIGEPWMTRPEFDDDTPNEFVAWCERNDVDPKTRIMFTNDIKTATECEVLQYWGKKRTGRFLPDALVRHKARIVSVRAERLQEITDEDAVAEGVVINDGTGHLPWTYFRDVWNLLHGKEAPWDSNPYVWRYEIGRVV